MNETVTKISNAQFDYKEPIWNEISLEAKELIDNLLIPDPFKRFSAHEAIEFIESKWSTQKETCTNLMNEEEFQEYIIESPNEMHLNHVNTFQRLKSRSSQCVRIIEK